MALSSFAFFCGIEQGGELGLGEVRLFVVVWKITMEYLLEPMIGAALENFEISKFHSNTFSVR